MTRTHFAVLLLDIAYADHWLTFWNDLLRNDYQGTGYIDGGRKQITRWLYRSLLDNKPSDQFVRELISPSAERPCLVTKNPISIPDLHATILTAMGISPKTAFEIEKRPFCVTEDGKGQPMRDLFASRRRSTRDQRQGTPQTPRSSVVLSSPHASGPGSGGGGPPRKR